MEQLSVTNEAGFGLLCDGCGINVTACGVKNYTNLANNGQAGGWRKQHHFPHRQFQTVEIFLEFSNFKIGPDR